MPKLKRHLLAQDEMRSKNSRPPSKAAPIFWAIGPDQFSRVYRVDYFLDRRFEFILADETELQFGR